MRRPFDGLSFCCTGLLSNVRDEVARKITSLGGTHYSDLMSDVQYLIVGERSTAKYDYCLRKRADIRFITHDAILSIHALWLKCEDPNAPGIDINTYRKPVFDAVNVCLARVELDIELLRTLFQRDHFRLRALKYILPQMKIQEYLSPANLTKVVCDNGGKVTESLTMANSCVVSTEMSGRRYEKALEWKIKVVHPVWIFDCMVRGALLDPKDYILNSSKNYYGGCEVWDEYVDEMVIANRRKQPTDDGPRRRAQNNSEIWNSIMDHTKMQSRKLAKSSVWDDDESDDNERFSNFTEDRFRNSDLSRSKTETADDYDGYFEKQRESEGINHLFLGFTFVIVGFTPHQTSLLTNVLTKHNGEVTSTTDVSETITHVIVPAANGAQSSTMLRILPSEVKAQITNGNIKVVTEWFVERSIYYKKLTFDRWGMPMKGLVPLSKKFKICITGFTGIELLHIEKLIQYLNFEFCESLAAQRDLLVVNINLFKLALTKSSPQLFQYKQKDIIDCPIYQQGSTTSVSNISTKNKINAAKNWGIPIVSIAYLWEILERSVGKLTLVTPDIVDLKWCLFAPSGFSRPQTLLEYVKNLSGNHLENTPESLPPRKREREEDQPLRLPSPRKPRSKRQNYGRLTGGKNEVSDPEGNREDTPLKELPLEEEADITIEEDVQVRYEDPESIRKDRMLLQKLGSSPKEGEKRRLTRGAQKVKKYTR